MNKDDFDFMERTGGEFVVARLHGGGWLVTSVPGPGGVAERLAAFSDKWDLYRWLTDMLADEDRQDGPSET